MANEPTYGTVIKNSSNQFVLFENLTAEVGARTLLKEQSLVVERGTITVLMGPSGVGKSVLADLVFNLPGRGTVHWKAQTLGNARDEGALVFQEGGGLPHLSVNDNLRLVSSRQDLCKMLAEQFELKPDTLAQTLSGGERRRLAVARALLAERRFLWLDEPEAGLDLKRVGELAEMLKEQTRYANLAMVVTTHNTAFAAEIADRILFFGHDGILTEVNVPHEPENTAVGHDATVANLATTDSGPQESGTIDHNALVATLTRKLADSERHSEFADKSLLSRIYGFMSRLRGSINMYVFSWLLLIAQSAPSLFSVLGNRQARSTFFMSLSLSAGRGILYYPFIGAIFGGVFILIFIYAAPDFLDPVGVIKNYGSTIVLRVTPPIASILVAACAGSTISSWIGQMSAGRQLDALAVLGIPVTRRVLAPTWWGLCIAATFSIITFALAFSTVFAVYVDVATAGDPLAVKVFWSSFLGGENVAAVSPISQNKHLVPALLKAVGYGTLIGGVTVSCASANLRSSSDVAAAVTRGIILSSIIVMSAELAILLVDRLQPLPANS